MSMLATEKLNSKELEEYGKCKWKIQEHRKTWRLFAEAMKTIRDGRLYRAEYKTFESFCKEETDYSREWVYKLIEAYEVSELCASVHKRIGECVKSANHWLALKDVPEDRIEAVLKRIEKDRNGKPVTTAIIEKAIHGPAKKAQPARNDSVESRGDTGAGLVDGQVLSSTTVTSAARLLNDRPAVPSPADISGHVDTTVDPVTSGSRLIDHAQQKPSVLHEIPTCTVESVVKASLTKADGIELLEELIRQLIEDGNEYSVAKICRKYAGASEPGVVQVDDPEEIARVENAMRGHQAMIVQAQGGVSIVDTVNSLHGARVLPEDPAQAAWQAFCDVGDDAKQVFVETIAELWKTHSGKKNLKVNTFVKPTIDEVRKYCEERQSKVDPEEFYDHYQASGWKLTTGVQLKDWQAAVRKWERDPRRKDVPGGNQPIQPPTLDEVRKYCEEQISKVNPDFFFNWYQAIGWKSKEQGWVKDWKHTLKTHENDPKFCRRIPTLDEVRKYVSETKGKIPAERFFNYFESGGWTEIGGRAVVDWQAKYQECASNPKWVEVPPSSQPKASKHKSLDDMPDE